MEERIRTPTRKSKDVWEKEDHRGERSETRRDSGHECLERTGHAYGGYYPSSTTPLIKKNGGRRSME